ncbi:uncharacterized protein FRV6_16891 [Fusarium oxysporum]|uniref:Uncharacterized protein n=1 Tax=Fusarium oxysporum TaxID=5507 RepID=A0A2H3TVX0_FUSOX|nr:uncharacterized protein FRV6_16891 [Fusarium oxysporum]
MGIFIRESQVNKTKLVSDWLLKIEKPSDDSIHKENRRKTNCKERYFNPEYPCHRIPTPSNSSHDSQLLANPTPQSLQDASKSTPRKCTRSITEMVGSYEEGDAIDDTPKASSRRWRKKAPDLSRGSTPSHASSSAASGASSPMKQLRYAAT